MPLPLLTATIPLILGHIPTEKSRSFKNLQTILKSFHRLSFRYMIHYLRRQNTTKRTGIKRHDFTPGSTTNNYRLN
jgi:hypothetical protein